MTIASAAHAAAPPVPPMPAARPSSEGDSSTGSHFASQLHGLAGDEARTPSSGQPKTPTPQQSSTEDAESASAATFIQQLAMGGTRFTLPRLPVRPAGQPSHTTTLKRPELKRNEQAAHDPTLTAPVTVAPPAPELEIAAAVAGATDEALGIDTEVPAKPATPRATPVEPEESVAPAVTAADSHTHSQEMAFAARVQPVHRTEHSALPAEMASAAAVASANKKVAGTSDDQTALPADHHGLLAAATNAVDRTAEPPAASVQAPHAAATAHRTEAPTPLAETASKATTPLKDISLQVNQPGKERIDVRVVQQGGEVRVSVHSGDASLTTGLRQGLSELQSRLEETGYRSELWKPGAAVAPVAQAQSAQASTNHSRGGEGQPQQQGGSQQESGRRNQNQSNQPRWVEELETSFGGGERVSGGSYGFTR